jgi:hypothetical protein
MRCNVENVRHEAVVERTGFFTVHEDEAGAIETFTTEAISHTRLEPVVGDASFKSPIAVLYPFALAGVETHVPIGDDSGFEKRSLYRTRHGNINRTDFGAFIQTGFERRGKAPGKRGVPGELPVKSGQVMYLLHGKASSFHQTDFRGSHGKARGFA